MHKGQAKTVLSLKPFFKEKLYQYVQKFEQLAWLDSCGYSGNQGTVELLVACGCKSQLSANVGDAFEQLLEFQKGKDWLFGYLGYDLKNELEPDLVSQNKDLQGFPDLFFFEPELAVKIKENSAELAGSEHLLEQVKQLNESHFKESDSSQIGVLEQINPTISKADYISRIEKVKERITRGDIYEMNFCQGFAGTGKLEAYNLFSELMRVSPTPFATLLRNEDQYILSASPERFLKRSGKQLMSQPIKGTIKRTAENDLLNKQNLANSLKDKTENVMIVDLVRNDLSKVAKDNTVNVDELFGIYSFPQVHQMISTVSCEIDTEISSIEAIKACYPMGSMTGAPKKKAMEIIEEFESEKRGVFSGAIGYLKGNDDFDFNVVIRSLFYDAKTQRISFSVGGAITTQSDPEQEYEESLLKAEAIFKVLR